MMCWYTNNTKRVIDSKGNTHYEKIEPKLRKTDGFMAWVHSMCCIDYLPEVTEMPDLNFATMTY